MRLRLKPQTGFTFCSMLHFPLPELLTPTRKGITFEIHLVLVILAVPKVCKASLCSLLEVINRAGVKSTLSMTCISWCLPVLSERTSSLRPIVFTAIKSSMSPQVAQAHDSSYSTRIEAAQSNSAAFPEPSAQTARFLNVCSHGGSRWAVGRVSPVGPLTACVLTAPTGSGHVGSWVTLGFAPRVLRVTGPPGLPGRALISGASKWWMLNN